MPFVALFLFVFAELSSLLLLGDSIGGWWVLLWCVVTALVGFQVIGRLSHKISEALAGQRQQMMMGFWPPQAVELGGIKGGFLVALFLIIPGLVTDAAAIFLAIKLWVTRTSEPEPSVATPPPSANADVELLPPGKVRSPFDKAPDIIDID